MILVTGATGKVGRELVNFLLERGEEVTAVTRTPDSAALPEGVRVVGGDPAQPLHSGNVVRGAYGEAATSPIHERDIAAVAAQTLVNGAHASQAYVLTGPQSLTQRQRVRIIGQTIGRSLDWEEMSADQMRRAMLAQGLPEDVPGRLLGYMADCLEKPGPSSSAVKDILGRPALSFADWAAEHAAVLRN